MKPTVGSLFAGIGGIDLGLERAGFQTKWQVEIDDYARKVLQRHFPAAERFRDVKQFPPKPDSTWLLHRWKERFSVDLLCGGFPCQDISTAGRGAGIDGERSGLWSEYKRIIRLLQPSFVLVENVPALTVRGIDRVLGDLAEIGYDAEWRVLSAAEFGALHLRKRIFIVAYPSSIGVHLERGWFTGENGEGAIFVDRDGSIQQVAELTDSEAMQWFEIKRDEQNRTAGSGEAMANANSERCDIWRDAREREPEIAGGCCIVPNSESAGLEGFREFATIESCGQRERYSWPEDSEGWGLWTSEPDVGRVADGVPSRVDRLRGLGNAVVPQVAEYIGRQIIHSLNRRGDVV